MEGNAPYDKEGLEKLKKAMMRHLHWQMYGDAAMEHANEFWKTYNHLGISQILSRNNYSRENEKISNIQMLLNLLSNQI